MAKRKDNRTKRLDADVVTAQSFVLVDAKGKERGEFSTFGDAVVLHLTTKQGEPMLTIQLDDKDSPSIAFFSKGGEVAVSLVSGENSTGFGISSPGGNSRIQCGIPNDPSAQPLGDRPCIVLFDEHGTKVISSD